MKTAQTIGLPVETQAGELLGKVSDVEIDIDAHTITTYVVSPSSLVQKIIGQEDLRVGPEQVVSITAEKMIVADTGEGETIDAGEIRSAIQKVAQQLGAAAAPDQTVSQEKKA